MCITVSLGEKKNITFNFKKTSGKQTFEKLVDKMRGFFPTVHEAVNF